MSISAADLFQRVLEYLDSKALHYSIEDDAFRLGFNLNNQLKECRMIIDIISYGNNSFSVRTSCVCPLTVPAEKEARILKFITKANYGMIDGYFTYHPGGGHPDEGTIAYTCLLLCNEIIPTLNDTKLSIEFPLQTMAQYGDALYNILKLNADPDEEIQRVEG